MFTIHNAAFSLTVVSSAYLTIFLEVRCIEMIVLQLEAARDQLNICQP